MSEKLTKKQQMILDFLKQEIRKNGYPPSIREICTSVGLSSTSTVHSHLESLERKCYIKRSPSKNRSIEILEDRFYVNNSSEIVNIPILGKVTAGEPIFAVEDFEESFPLPLYVVGNDRCFMLRVKGESMIEAGIYDKDLVIIKQQETAENGDIVLALVEDSATIKRFFKEKGHIRLQAENPFFEPIIVKELTILGKVIGLFRKF